MHVDLTPKLTIFFLIVGLDPETRGSAELCESTGPAPEFRASAMLFEI